MNDNRDIDEILASLDALLREGDSHNDDIPVESINATSDVDALKEAPKADVKPVKDHLNNATCNGKTREPLATETVFNGVIAQQEGSMARVILTEDMMVENPQVSLPLPFNSKTPNKDDVIEDGVSASEILSLDDVIANAIVQQGSVDNEPAMGEKSNNGSSEHIANEHVTANPVMCLHKQEVDQLLTLVSLDVSSHLQDMLPKLIKKSLHAHLADMQHESDENNKTSDDE